MLDLAYLQLRPEQQLPTLIGERFRAVLVADAPVTDAWRKTVADWLIDRGCLYFVAWGVACGRWEYDVDTALLQRFDYGEVPDADFVMTSSHDDEPLSDALWFCRMCAFHGTVDLERTLIVHIAGEGREQSLLNAYREAGSSD